MKKNQRILIIFSLFFLAFSLVLNPNFVKAAASQTSDIEDKVLDEIVSSNLEENTYVVDGKVFNGYSTYKEAGVSEEAFKRFEKIIDFTNDNIEQGNFAVGKNIKDVKVDIPQSCQCNSTSSFAKKQSFSANGILYQTYKISGSQATKIGKLLAGGAGAAVLASELGIPTAVAAVLTALYGANELCNWNSNGYTLYYIPFPAPSGFCLPN